MFQLNTVCQNQPDTFWKTPKAMFVADAQTPGWARVWLSHCLYMSGDLGV